jgi:hypothetical protein
MKGHGRPPPHNRSRSEVVSAAAVDQIIDPRGAGRLFISLLRRFANSDDAVHHWGTGPDPGSIALSFPTRNCAKRKIHETLSAPVIAPRAHSLVAKAPGEPTHTGRSAVAICIRRGP